MKNIPRRPPRLCVLHCLVLKDDRPDHRGCNVDRSRGPFMDGDEWQAMQPKTQHPPDRKAGAPATQNRANNHSPAGRKIASRPLRGFACGSASIRLVRSPISRGRPQPIRNTAARRARGTIRQQTARARPHRPSEVRPKAQTKRPPPRGTDGQNTLAGVVSIS